MTLEARKGGKTDKVFWLVFVCFKVFDTSLPQEGGTRMDRRNQQIATQMSDPETSLTGKRICFLRSLFTSLVMLQWAMMQKEKKEESRKKQLSI